MAKAAREPGGEHSGVRPTARPERDQHPLRLAEWPPAAERMAAGYFLSRSAVTARLARIRARYDAPTLQMAPPISKGLSTAATK